jgi:predicted DNA-binding transcriptional regulator YafY
MLKIEKGRRITFTYTNWEGKTSQRTAYVEGFEFGSNQWHKEAQFFLVGFDTDKNAIRCFAVKDISNLITW